MTWYKNDKKIHSTLKTLDKSVSAEITILTNVTDNEARYRCEAANSATEIPLFETVTMSVHCKWLFSFFFVKKHLSANPTKITVVKAFFFITNYYFAVAPETVKIRKDPVELKPNEEATLTCDSSSSNPPAKLSWWREGIPVLGLNNVTKAGLHGGKVSSLELKLNITEQMNGIIYTCQAKNEALQRSVHDAITLQVLCKFISDFIHPI